MQQAKPHKYLHAVIYNFMYFGMQREANSEQLNGHIGIIFDIEKNLFYAYKDSDYAGLTSVNDNPNKTILTLNESEQRIVNDNIYKYLQNKFSPIDGTYDFHKKIEQLIENNPQGYKYHYGYVSNNIQFGDKVKDTETGEEFVVNNNHDIEYINKNQFYHVIGRSVGYNPTPVKFEAFKKAWKLKLINELRTLCNTNFAMNYETLPQLKFNQKLSTNELKAFKILHTYKVNNKDVINTYYYTKNDNWHLVTINDKVVFFKHSSISAPIHDLVDLLIGNVYSEYNNGSRTEFNLLPVDSGHNMFDQEFKDKNAIFNKATSFKYNNRLISLIGKDYVE